MSELSFTTTLFKMYENCDRVFCSNEDVTDTIIWYSDDAKSHQPSMLCVDFEQEIFSDQDGIHMFTDQPITVHDDGTCFAISQDMQPIEFTFEVLRPMTQEDVK